jgi:hypothetical protein
MKTIALPWVLFVAAVLTAQQPPPPPLPVREVTVFKDGHAYVIRERALSADGSGEVVLDDLPQPVLGTFWPYATGGATLVSAKAGRQTVARDRPAVDFREIARANIGKDVVVVTVSNDRHEGKLLDVPVRGDAGGAQLLLLQTQTGTRALPFDQLRDLEVRGGFTANVSGEQQQDRLVLRVQGGGDDARVGVMYVQEGLRWIPAYRIDVDGAGRAAVQFEATLVNDLVDLEGATVNLVIGVPKFEFAGLLDPISLQQEAAAVADRMAGAMSNRFSNALFNSLTTQSAGYTGPAAAESTPAADRGDSNEDLFVFPVRDVTLKRGERLVLPIATFALTYRDVYRLDVPFSPPMEMRQNFQSQQAAELARELAAPKARHVLRLQNGSDAPLTTAPALVLRQGRVLAQGRLRYTPKGAETDLEINVAIDVCVEVEEHDVGRDETVRFGKEQYGRVDVRGAIELSNRKAVPIEVEVTRRTLGIGDAVEQGGTDKQLGLAEAWFDADRPSWWSWWSWPQWWFQRNGFAEFRWTVRLEPGASTRLEAGWHYFWR